MKATVVYCLCYLAGATAFLPASPMCRNGASKISTQNVSGRSRICTTTSLAMGFDFKGMLDKMGDTRYARVRHILVTEKGEEGKARLAAVKEEIGGDLDTFSEVAEQISTCSSASKGGRLKLLARGETVPAFDEVAFSQPPGGVYGPVETEFGTHLIYIESCRKPENTWKMLFDDVVKKVKGEDE